MQLTLHMRDCDYHCCNRHGRVLRRFTQRATGDSRRLLPLFAPEPPAPRLPADSMRAVPTSTAITFLLPRLAMTATPATTHDVALYRLYQPRCRWFGDDISALLTLLHHRTQTPPLATAHGAANAYVEDARVVRAVG